MTSPLNNNSLYKASLELLLAELDVLHTNGQVTDEVAISIILRSRKVLAYPGCDSTSGTDYLNKTATHGGLDLHSTNSHSGRAERRCVQTSQSDCQCQDAEQQQYIVRSVTQGNHWFAA